MSVLLKQKEMREIKFRAIRKGSKEFLFGDLVHNCEGDAIFPSVLDDNALLNSPDYYTIDSETIGQFVGLPDKNGKDAWEGDIIYIKHCECVAHNQDGEEIWESRKGVISFEDSMFVFDGHSCGTLPLFAYKDSFEVIGNIHQNPELLQS